MISHFRLVLIAFFLMAFQSLALAQSSNLGPCPSGFHAVYQDSISVNLPVGPWSTPAEACTAGTAAYGAEWSGVWDASALNCTLLRNGSGGYSPTLILQSCPVDTVTPPSDSGPCPQGSVGTKTYHVYWSASLDANAPIVGASTDPREIPGRSYCMDSCEVVPQSPVVACQTSTTPNNGYYETSCNFNTIRSGSTCTGGDASPTSQPPAPPGGCPAGSVPSGLDSNGTVVCKGSSPDVTKSPVSKSSVTTTNTDGGTTTTNTTVTTNADGSKTTVTEVVTTAPGGSTSSTTSSDTSTKPGTNEPGKDDLPELSDLCKLHPDLTICQHSSVSGSCDAVACTGDAIQCATLRAASEMQCKQKKDQTDIDASPLTALGTNLAAGNDPLGNSPSVPGNATVVQVATSLDTSGWLGGGSCFADKTFTVQGHSIAIPFSHVCDYLIALRYALMVVASLISFRMVSGAINS